MPGLLLDTEEEELVLGEDACILILIRLRADDTETPPPPPPTLLDPLPPEPTPALFDEAFPFEDGGC